MNNDEIRIATPLQRCEAFLRLHGKLVAGEEKKG